MKLRDRDDDLGAAFRSADGDAPRPEAKAALMAALGIGAVTLATATTATAATATAAGASASASAAGAGAATTATTAAAAGGSTAVAKGAGAFAIAKWVIASAVVVSGAAATIHVVAPADSSTNPRGSDATMTTPALPAVRAPVARAAAPGTPGAPATPEAIAEPTPEIASPEELPTAAPVLVAPAAAVAPVAAPVVAAPSAAQAATPFAARSEGSEEVSPPLTHGPLRMTVHYEIVQLERVRALIAQGRSAEALEALRAYRQQFPGGTLEQEASVLEIEALAKSGQKDRAKQLGERFLSQHARSPFEARIVRATGIVVGSPAEPP